MTVLVYFNVFYPDNHQGGSGHWQDQKVLVDIKDDITVSEINHEIRKKIGDKILSKFQHHNWTDEKFNIHKIEILNCV